MIIQTSKCTIRNKPATIAIHEHDEQSRTNAQHGVVTGWMETAQDSATNVSGVYRDIGLVWELIGEVRVLTDYDGVFELFPVEIEALKAAGFDVSGMYFD